MTNVEFVLEVGFRICALDEIIARELAHMNDDMDAALRVYHMRQRRGVLECIRDTATGPLAPSEFMLLVSRVRYSPPPSIEPGIAELQKITREARALRRH